MRVFIYYDLSGSVSETLFNKFEAEAGLRKSQLQNVEFEEFCFSYEVMAKANSFGRLHGGTDVGVVRKHFLEHASKGDALWLFSDGYHEVMESLPDGYNSEFVHLDE